MILQTRLQMPPLRKVRVNRERLTRKLNQLYTCKLTLVVAPAGFGKTTLISEWVENRQVDVAWLSLDGLNLTGHEFVLYIIHTLRQLDDAIGHSAQTLLQASSQSIIEEVLTLLVNDLLTITVPVILTLDDYHSLANQANINTILQFLIHNMPSNIHIIMISRELPDMNLSRLRAQTQLLEITSAELRFTAIEVARFFDDVMAIQLSDSQRLKLESKTEGWVTGLQLAGNSILKTNDAEAFIHEFSGHNYAIRQYLLEEVFQYQSEQIQTFLITTAFLEELCADLCNAVLQITDSQVILDQLEASQLFIVPQDYQHQWYRYHGIFKEFLNPLLNNRQPETIQTLYRRASNWYEANHNIYTAIQYAVLGHDDEHVASLLEVWLSQEEWVHHGMYRLEEWFKALSQAVIETHLPLYLNYVWLKLEVYDSWDDILEDIRQIQQILNRNTANTDPHTLAILTAQADMVLVNYARSIDDSEQVIDRCQAILEYLPADERYIRSGAIAHMASAYEALHDYKNARLTYQEAIQRCQSSNNIDGLLFASWKLMELLITVDDLPSAKSIYDNIEPYHTTRTGPDMGAIYIAIGEVHRRTNYLMQAKIHLEEGITMCKSFPAWKESTALGRQRLDLLTQHIISVDTLTERELETLRFLQSDLSMTDIADQLSVSISTIRTYCKRIYNKLQVHSRAEAVFRARELDII